MAKEKRPAAAPEELVAVPYERLVSELDEVVAKLEGGELSLEESLAAFERGVRLSQAAEARLDAAEQRVEQLLAGDRTAPLDPPAAEAATPKKGRPAKSAGTDDDGDVPF